MNLGIEDAWVFAELAAKGGLDRYHELRRPVDAAVVRRIERLTRFVSSESAAVRFVRQWVMPVALGIPAVTHRMRRIATGLDHPIPTP